ncbi:MAG: hypothetical protein LBD86_01455 [Spirochaetaceae bacterium]|nr:hypothetical protein [Spirochaetaceae bacterium]
MSPPPRAGAGKLPVDLAGPGTVAALPRVIRVRYGGARLPLMAALCFLVILCGCSGSARRAACVVAVYCPAVCKLC